MFFSFNVIGKRRYLGTLVRGVSHLFLCKNRGIIIIKRKVCLWVAGEATLGGNKWAICSFFYCLGERGNKRPRESPVAIWHKQRKCRQAYTYTLADSSWTCLHYLDTTRASGHTREKLCRGHAHTQCFGLATQRQ